MRWAVREPPRSVCWQSMLLRQASGGRMGAAGRATFVTPRQQIAARCLALRIHIN